MPVYGAGARVRGTLVRGGPPLEGGAYPRARRSPLEGNAAPRAGGARPKGVLPLERGEACSRGSFRGPPRWAVRVPVGRVLHG
jgi:hypothetical protein